MYTFPPALVPASTPRVAPPHAPVPSVQAARIGAALPQRPYAGRAAPSFGVELDRDRGFAQMLRAYKDFGGLGRGDEVADRFRDSGGDIGQLARWIVERHVISFEWRSQLWLPWFQFAGGDMTVSADAQKVARELRDTFDGWHLAHWFVESNCWLGDRKPLQLLRTQPDDVLHAARTDRFVAVG